METWIYWIGQAGTVAFVVTGVLAVAPKGIDLFSATVLGIITAVGGGTMRAIILGVPVFWSLDQNYIWISIVASVATFYASSAFSRKNFFKQYTCDVCYKEIDALRKKMFRSIADLLKNIQDDRKR